MVLFVWSGISLRNCQSLMVPLCSGICLSVTCWWPMVFPLCSGIWLSVTCRWPVVPPVWSRIRLSVILPLCGGIRLSVTCRWLVVRPLHFTLMGLQPQIITNQNLVLKITLMCDLVLSSNFNKGGNNLSYNWAVFLPMIPGPCVMTHKYQATCTLKYLRCI